MIYYLLILPGLVAAYVLFLRALLMHIPALQKFYAEADTFWKKVWAFCGNSLTVAWSYVLAFIGGLLNRLDDIAAALGDPNFKDQVAAFLHSDPKYLGWFSIGVAVITILARFRSIVKAG